MLYNTVLYILLYGNNVLEFVFHIETRNTEVIVSRCSLVKQKF